MIREPSSTHIPNETLGDCESETAMYRLFTLILLLGCTAPALAEDCTLPAMKEPHATLVIYLYRDKGSLRHASIYVDEEKICSLTNGRYLIVHIPAGEHKVRSSDAKNGVQQTFDAGMIYYFLVNIKQMGKKTKSLWNFWNLDPVPACFAQIVLPSLKPQDGEAKPLPVPQNRKIEGVPEAPAS